MRWFNKQTRESCKWIKNKNDEILAYAVDLYGEEMAGCLEDHSEQQYIHFEKDNESIGRWKTGENEVLKNIINIYDFGN
ncbi:hypothetical protein C1645_818956 [Glomus cerebriforme]|uniref:Uncharacterized protein n=1 Tax=Glomus cerebriforme TaxID=658196 RepID=A0A397T686_9GLOM|nr:hypothetical protein C1645_818956 [Glomus cerebriforme]